MVSSPISRFNRSFSAANWSLAVSFGLANASLPASRNRSFQIYYWFELTLYLRHSSDTVMFVVSDSITILILSSELHLTRGNGTTSQDWSNKVHHNRCSHSRGVRTTTLSYDALRVYLELLLKKDLLVRNEKTSKYKTTRKELEYLRLNKSMNKIVHKDDISTFEVRTE